MQKPQRRDNNFNLIRLVFASLVILGHAPELTDGNRSRELLTQITRTLTFGDLAVNGFFVVSGYLILQSWERGPHLRDFLRKRVLRIYPGFIAAVLVSVFVVGAIGASEPDYFARISYGKLVAQMMVLLKPSTPEVFAGKPYAEVNGSLWTIKFEFMCYLLTAALGVLGLARKRGAWLGLFVVTAVTYVVISENVDWIAANVWKGRERFWIEVVKTLRLSSFYLAGACFHAYADSIAFNAKGLRIMLLGFAVCLLLPSVITAGLLLTFPYLVLYVALAVTPWKAMNNLPDISYGVYLYGWPLTKLAYWFYPSLSPWLATGAVLLLSATCGLISWYGVEKPFLSLKSRTRQTALPQGAA